MRSPCRSTTAALVLILAILYCNEPTLAQSISPGIEVTANYSTLIYEEPHDTWDPSGRLSFGVKAYADIPVIGQFHLRPGIRFSRIQNRIRFTPPPSSIPNGEISTSQDYVSAPIQITYSILGGPFFLAFGPEPAFLLASSMNIPESTGPTTDSDDLIDRMNRFNLAVVGGFGAAFRLKSHRLHMHIRFSRGITGVAKDSRTVSWYSDWVTQESGLAVGYTF